MTNPALHAILLAAGLLVVGVFLRLRLRVLRLLYVPAAVVAGTLGFALAQGVLTNGAVTSRLPSLGAWGKDVLAEWGSWPGTLIAVVFAGLLLERPRAKSFAEALRRGVRSGVLAWVIILGQLLIGLAVYAAFVRPVNRAIPPTFGQLLEISWAGGHGSAAGMGAIYDRQGFTDGRDLAFFSATVGLIYGVLSGLAFVNLAIRRGWVNRQSKSDPPRSGDDVAPLSSQAVDSPPTTPTLPPGVVEPLVPAILVLAVAVVVGLLLQRGFFALAGLALGADDPALRTQPIDYAANVPLFLFTLLGGWVVRRAAEMTGAIRYVDAVAVQRFVGIAMEFLIVAGLATMRVESIGRFGWPLVVMLVLAAVWSGFCLLVLARVLLPRAYWFELGLLNYGFSTANTPQGLMLLRIVDPDLRTNAATDYAVAAPLSAPFIGGGIITFLVLPVLLERFGVGWVMGGLIVAITALLASGVALARSRG
jgi:ESS family glutamate:Na+ symporter